MSGNGKTGRWRRCILWCFFDALRVKIRDQGSVGNKAVYLALGIDADSKEDVLGIWIEHNEGAKFWMKVMNEVRNRGMKDILIAVVHGLKGFPEAITTTFPQTIVQRCIVHQNSLQPVLLQLERPLGCGAGVAGYLPGRER
jgi:putative transposase